MICPRAGQHLLSALSLLSRGSADAACAAAYAIRLFPGKPTFEGVIWNFSLWFHSTHGLKPARCLLDAKVDTVI